jgi:2'-hydroxyisoflavone reductase
VALKILVLGGTRFVGRGIVEVALDRGHDVTLFNRGSNRELFPSARRIIGDRKTADIEEIGHERWDCVVDVSAYHPAEVRSALRALDGDVTQYLFVSTVSVYDNPSPGATEDARLIDVDEDVPRNDPRSYGGLKVLCERTLRDSLRDRLTVIRPTVVIGPYDTTDRFPWWVRQVERGGRIEVPRRLDQPLQLIDAGDVGAFAVRLIEQSTTGTYNTAGPVEPLTLGRMLEVLAGALGSSVEPVPVEDDRGHDIPLTLPADGSWDGMFSVAIDAALRAGLQLRPLDESTASVARWQTERVESR